MKLSELNLNENIQKGLNEAGFTEFLEVQTKTIPHILDGKDVLVQSQTGTGKTAAFLLPIFQLMSEKNHNSMALIIVPTRELATQVEKEAKKLGKFTGFKTACLYGGVRYLMQEKSLREGAQIIIATPGRLLDMSNRGKVDFKKIDFMVVDEADRLFDMGFMPDIKKIFKGLRPKSERMTMLFSATLNYEVKNLARDYMKDVAEVEINPEHKTVEKINQTLYHVGKNEKMNLLLGLFQRDNSQNGIIFVNTKSKAREISSRLKVCGIQSEYLIGDLPQSKRSRIIEDFKNKKINFLIATDVASRGLHVDDLELVINFDLPLDSESYVHRIGRTARVGKSGRAITFACEKYIQGLKPIEDYIDMKIPVAYAEDALFVEDKSSQSRFQKERSLPGAKVQRGNQGRETRRNTAANKRHVRPAAKSIARKEESAPLRIQATKSNPAQKGSKSTASRPARSNLGSAYWESKNHATGKRNESAPQRKNGTSLNERLEYYKNKYGENFSAGKVQGKDEKKSKGLSYLKKISNLIFRKYPV